MFMKKHSFTVHDKTIAFTAFERYQNRFLCGYTRCYDESGRSLDFSDKGIAGRESLDLNLGMISRVLDFDLHGLVMVRQMHTDAIKKVTGPEGYEDDRPIYDAMITNCAGITLATRHADCVPIYMVDPVGIAIGLAHSGWKGTLQAIGPKMAMAMHEAYGCRFGDLVCVVGPSICKDCYEVQKDVADLFTNSDDFAGHYVLEKGTSYRLDMKGYIFESLTQAGLDAGNIHCCQLCTKCNMNLFYSHRGSLGSRERSLALLGIREQGLAGET